jgi:hypothetical protein
MDDHSIDCREEAGNERLLIACRLDAYRDSGHRAGDGS